MPDFEEKMHYAWFVCCTRLLLHFFCYHPLYASHVSESANCCYQAGLHLRCRLIRDA